MKALTVLTDKKLTIKIQEGSTEAFRELYDKLAVDLLNFSMSLTRDRQESEDIVQNVFVALWNNREELDPEKSVKAYLFRSALNGAYKYLRHEKVIKKNEEFLIQTEKKPLTPFDDLTNKEIRSKIDSAISSLPDGSRTVFELHRFGGFSYAEIADMQDISINTVKTQMGRALKFLRKRLSPFLITFL
ncbi:RNA polymerase sigma factor [candidate division KSB1 bacterium]